MSYLATTSGCRSPCSGIAVAMPAECRSPSQRNRGRLPPESAITNGERTKTKYTGFDININALEFPDGNYLKSDVKVIRGESIFDNSFHLDVILKNGIGSIMSWTVTLSKKVEKQYQRLPAAVQDRLDLLAAEIEQLGPVRGNWKNYGKLTGKQHHCHIKTGRPTYVAVWEEADESIKLIEVTYAGTHEKAPY